MLVQNISPVIFSLGPVEVRWYGLVYVIGFLLGYWWLRRLARQGAIKNLTEDLVDNYTLLIIAGVVVGGRLFEFVFYQPRILLSDPLEVLRIWHGGMSFHGGLIGVALVTWLFARKHRISLLELGDALTIPAAFALFLGRIANFINSELPGKVTNAAWCVQFPNAPDPAHRLDCRHPSQLYESFKNLVIFGALQAAWGWRSRRPGFLTWLFITLYGLFRFIVNFWRDDPLVLLGLSMGQVLSLLMFLIGAGVLVWKYAPFHHNRRKNY